ncbi:Protein N-acetyltransferase, RimJ/RimL family [Chryseobacterium wanjuense]|uniref:Protein N-acetyltransferase, RimJ/RimL family n=1 Tax=Chryseobacterium wanjuense TaxID=356305 RepID=A0A1I0RL89_9FLAO|nr:GNAT family N-acetyltransferase [Chryseobacterium wanjuense]SEW41780.1 Protein N-acetyltransferase, RimJ/RimL family [Chryseobacterium wanjuense]
MLLNLNLSLNLRFNLNTMHNFPKIETERLILSQLKEEDLPFVVDYLQDKIFSDLTSNIPYPYRQEDAEFWLKMSKEAFEKGSGFTFAIRDKDEKIIGAIGLHDRGEGKAELGYWMAKTYWNQGFVTEAAKAVLDFGFKELTFNKIFATHFLHNPASGKIMEKIGMKKEEILHQHIKKDGKYFDIALYSVLKKFN